MAVGALVCGIVGAVLGLIPLLYILALALGITALVLGLIARRRVSREPTIGRKTMATWGAALGAVAIALGVIGAVIVEDAVDDIDQAFEEIETVPEQTRREFEQAQQNP
jgi:hypothetical protein